MIPDNINSYEFLVKKHEGLVYYVVNRFNVSSFDRDDLIQAGLMGLLEAIKRYDINRDTCFSTYAIPYIIGSVKKEYHKQNSVISNEYYQRLIRNVQSEEGNLSYIELAKKYKTTVENIIVAQSFSNRLTYLKDEEVELIAAPREEKIDFGVLDKEEFLIYQMRVLENKTQMEIAEKLGINQSTISRKLKNITKKVLLRE